MLGRIVSIVKEPPHRWEVTRQEFDLILQQEAPAYVDSNYRPLPLEFADLEMSENSIQKYYEKNFVEEMKKYQMQFQIIGKQKVQLSNILGMIFCTFQV